MSLPSWTSKYVGLPYKPHGRGPDSFDCFGLVRFILQEEFNIILPAYDELYADEAEVSDVLAIAREEEGPYIDVTDEDRQIGDLVLLSSIREVLHIGLMLDNVRFIHCNSHELYSNVQRIDAAAWKNRILGIYRHRQMERGEE